MRATSARYSRAPALVAIATAIPSLRLPRVLVWLALFLAAGLRTVVPLGTGIGLWGLCIRMRGRGRTLPLLFLLSCPVALGLLLRLLLALGLLFPLRLLFALQLLLLPLGLLVALLLLLTACV